MTTPTTAVELRDKMSRALARADALIDEWAGDTTPITRSAAADLFASVLELNGWEEQDAAPTALRLVADGSGR